MSILPKLTETDIRDRATDSSFERGRDYYIDGAVLEIARRENRLTAEVEGSSYEPYQVTIALGQRGIEKAYCTCPYDWGGDCKHIVAVLLTYIHSSEEVEELPSVEDMLADLDRDQLQDLILKLVERQPGIANLIQQQLPPMQGKAVQDTADSGSSPRQRQSPLDSESLRRQVHAVLHRLDHVRLSELDSRAHEVAHGLDKILEKARTFVEANDGRNALIILEALTQGIVDELESVYDPHGEVIDTFDDMKPLWTEAVLVADLTLAERMELAEKMDDWESKLNQYYAEDVFSAPQAAAIQGWDHPPLQRVLEGNITNLGAWEDEAPWFADDLAVARLNVLARQGRFQEYLYLAEAEGQMDLYLTMLARLGRIQEAVDNGIQYMESAGEALSLAQALHEKGETESALRVAEHGLKLQGGHSELLRWIRDVSAGAGLSEKALTSAIDTFREDLNLENYKAVESLAGERWPELRDKLLESLRQIKLTYPGAQVYIFLYEGLIDDAIAALGNCDSYVLVEEVVDAASSSHHDWVISACRQQAESIMNAAKSNAYYHAARWLQKARTAYLATGREAEWQQYLADLLDRHRRKSSLIPLLEDLL
jgi:uncharacterized Zn finger protein